MNSNILIIFINTELHQRGDVLTHCDAVVEWPPQATKIVISDLEIELIIVFQISVKNSVSGTVWDRTPYKSNPISINYDFSNVKDSLLT